MKYNIELNIERDNLWRVTKRTLIHNGEQSVTSYRYNDHGDLCRESEEINGTLVKEVIYQYVYDDHFNKTMKFCDIDFNKENTRSVVYYKNEYDNNHLTRKVCYLDDVIYYENRYFYQDIKLIRVERYNRGFGLWRTELYTYYDNSVEITVYMADGTLSHYVLCQLKDGAIASKQIISPVRGKYQWLIWGCKDGSYDIYCGETFLTADLLKEIADYVLHIKKEDHVLLIIGCSDTVVDTSEKDIMELESFFMDQGISIQYA